MSFIIAGIKILNGCEPHIRKVLKEDKTYLFSSRYEVDHADELTLSISSKANNNLFSKTLYNIYSGQRTLEISVGAIVGKNGDGKSTLIEVALRVMNNFAVKLGFLENQSTLQFVKGVSAILYYEIDSNIYAIKCDDDTVSWYKNGGRVIVPDGTDIEKKRFLKEYNVPDLFYTMVINYSLYAYTSASLGDGMSEDGYWIDGLFHKNDSYQTPVVLSPMRTKGDINVVREAYLSKQRLMSIFANSKNADKIRKVSVTETAVGYAFSLEKESKFLRKILRNYLLDNFQDEQEWKELKTSEYPQTKAPEEIVGRFLDFWGDFRYELEQNPTLINLCSLYVSNLTRPRKSDLRKYLTLINNTINPANPKTNKRGKSSLGRVFNLLVSSKGELSKLNYKQFYRLLLVLLVWRVLTEGESCGMFEASLEETLKNPGHPRNAAMLYVVYKFISIVETYKGFCNGYYLQDDNFVSLTREWPNRDAIGTIRLDLKQILRTYDYRTLKFYQTINYLLQDKDYYGAEECVFPKIDYDYFLSFDNIYDEMKGQSLKTIQWHLPCPIFEGDVVLFDGKEYYPLDTLSSGMIQRLNTVGSLIYHLRNLDDDQQDDDMIAYENVSIILEEVELYYHPEYQKSYLNYLLEQIERAELQRLERINLIFITHSPFILSDIVKDNILCLKDGEPEKLELKTFGANIHDLLRHPFFMENGTIGDFAQKIINRIIVSLSLYESIMRFGDLFDVQKFKKENVELSDYMDFLPCNIDGSFDMESFMILYSPRSLKEAILMLDEPIIKNSLAREYERILSNYVAPVISN